MSSCRCALIEKPTPYDDLSATDVLIYARRKGAPVLPYDLCANFGCTEESATSMLSTLAAIGEMRRDYNGFTVKENP